MAVGRLEGGHVHARIMRILTLGLLMVVALVGGVAIAAPPGPECTITGTHGDDRLRETA